MHLSRFVFAGLLAVFVVACSGNAVLDNSNVFAPARGGASSLGQKPRRRGKVQNIAVQAPSQPVSLASVHGHMGIVPAIVNMVADLCPHGMLPLAFGMAAGATGTGGLASALLLASFGAISGYTLVSIGRACQMTGRAGLRDTWSLLVGDNTAWVVDAVCALLTFGCCVFYSAFIGDIFSALAQAAGLPPVLQQRPVVLCLMSLFPLLPLCLLKDLSALGVTSTGGLAAIAYTACFVFKRSIDGSYAPGGKFFELMDAALQPKFPEAAGGPLRIGAGTPTLLNMVCVAFLCHYNGAGYYGELKTRNVKEFSKVVSVGMSVSLGVFCMMMFSGYRTFGSSAQALLLNNYHKSADFGATLARMCTGASIVCGYPLMFAGFKQAFFSLVAGFLEKGKAGETPAEAQKRLTLRRKFTAKDGSGMATQAGTVLAVVGVITAIACKCTEEDVGVVIGIVGALLGSFTCYVVPAVLNIKLATARLPGMKTNGLNLKLWEVYFNRMLIGVGIFFAVFGTRTTLLEAAAGGHH